LAVPNGAEAGPVSVVDVTPRGFYEHSNVKSSLSPYVSARGVRANRPGVTWRIAGEI